MISWLNAPLSPAYATALAARLLILEEDCREVA
jgi:hypothetical protein